MMVSMSSRGPTKPSLEGDVPFWFNFVTHNSVQIRKIATHSSAELMKNIHIPSMHRNFFKTQRIIKQVLHILCSSWHFLPHIPRIVPFILHVSSKGTRNSAHIRKKDTENYALLNKKLPINNGTSPYPRSTKVPPNRVYGAITSPFYLIYFCVIDN